jgi:hypothetical protein
MNASFRIAGIVAVGLFLLATGAARADMDVTGSYELTKTKTIDETIFIIKNVDVGVSKQVAVDAASEQEILKNQTNIENFVQDETPDADAEILGSGVGMVGGIVLINQSPGFENNQANEVGVTQTASQEQPVSGAFAHAQVDVEQENTINEYVNIFENADYDNLISGSFEGGTGIVGINQASNSLNNQNNAAAIALGDPAVFALGEAHLGQLNTGNITDVPLQMRTDTIDTSFGTFTGIAMVNQSSGVLNNQAKSVTMGMSSAVAQ